METITLSLTKTSADELYAAVGRQLNKGDLQPVEGQSQFASALVAALGYTPAEPTNTPKPGNTPLAAAFTGKK